MRKLICLMLALLMSMSVVLPAAAAEENFVPSITFKDGAEILSAGFNVLPGTPGAEVFANGVADCLVTTSIAQAMDKSTDITQEQRDQLLDIYKQLEEGTMKLPLKGETVVKELFSLSFKAEGCTALEDHYNKAEVLKQEGCTLTVDFKTEIKKNASLVVLTYIDGEWVEAEETKIGANGVVTCTFEDIGPTAFVLTEAAPDAEAGTSPFTGDMIAMWFVVMAVCAAGIVVVLMAMKKQRK